FDIWVMLGFGVAGHVLRKLEYDLAPFVIAFVLAPLLEQSLRQSLVMSPDGAMILIKRPVTALLLAASVALTFLMFRRRTKTEGGLPTKIWGGVCALVCCFFSFCAAR